MKKLFILILFLTSCAHVVCTEDPRRETITQIITGLCQSNQIRNLRIGVCVAELGEPNASMNADGVMIVSRTLLEKADDDEVILCIVAHELAHHLLGHSTRRDINKEFEADQYALNMIRRLPIQDPKRKYMKALLWFNRKGESHPDRMLRVRNLK